MMTRLLKTNFEKICRAHHLHKIGGWPAVNVSIKLKCLWPCLSIVASIICVKNASPRKSAHQARAPSSTSKSAKAASCRPIALRINRAALRHGNQHAGMQHFARVAFLKEGYRHQNFQIIYHNSCMSSSSIIMAFIQLYKRNADNICSIYLSAVRHMASEMRQNQTTRHQYKRNV